ncbi:MAG: hypothetical protein IJV72_07465 [Clostridia bacterium]|nr:hypothetical protein [Clostridia bacterium]
MSEAQKIRRERYKRNRGKLIMAQSIVVAILTLLMIISAVTYVYINKTYFVEYTEASDVDYKVQLKDNEFYDSEYLGRDQAYVASLIDDVIATFKYELNTDTEGANYEYSYNMEAQLEIIDDRSGEALFKPTYVIKEEQRFTHNTDVPLRINEIAVLDYQHYNDLANKFIETYDLNDTTSALIVRIKVKVYSSNASFNNATVNEHIVALNIPLTEKAVNIEMTASVPTSQVKTIVCDGSAGKEVFKVGAVILGVFDALAILFMVAFIYLTKNSDITYENKVKKILSAYKSHIQRITNPFDSTGYQVLYVDSFDALLEIRETLQEPILMYENEDKTCAEFMIPTKAKLLYLYVIKVDGYEELYTPAETVEVPVEEPVEESVAEEPIIEEVVEEPVEEVEEEPVIEPVIIPQPVIIDMPEEEIIAEETVELPIEEEAVEEEPVEEIAIEEPVIEEVVEEPEEVVEEGVEVIEVIWPERPERNKTYKYDPDGETVNAGDVVLVPTRDVERDREIVREAEVAKGNYKVDPATLEHPLKKIICVVRRKATEVFTSMIIDEKKDTEDK